MTAWSLRIALGVFALANLVVLGVAAYDRLGPEHGRLTVEECRLIVNGQALGLWEMLGDSAAPLALRAVSLYRPRSGPRPEAERLAEFGFSVDPEGRQPPAKRAFVALEADGPALERYEAAQSGAAAGVIVVRDVAVDPETLQTRYGTRSGLAVTKGLADVTVSEGEVSLAPRLRRDRLHLGRKARRDLADLAPQETEACRSRFMAEIVYGAAYTPRVARLRPLERVEQ